MDDFGIVAVEALSAGTPVIAYKKGGALDYIKDGVNGIFFNVQTVSNLVTALEKCLDKKFNYQKISDNASVFSKDNFKNNFRDYITKLIK